MTKIESISPFIKISKFYSLNTQIIKYPIVTDKATRLLENNQYCFIVDRYSNKASIKTAIELLFHVKVLKVNTAHSKKKKKRLGKYFGFKSAHKKAIVTLAEGNIIDLFTDNSLI